MRQQGMIVNMKNIWLAIKGYFRRLDKVLLLLCLIAVSFSCLILYSELRAGFISTGSRRFNPFTMQVIAAIIGIAALLVMSVINYRFMAKMLFIHPLSMPRAKSTARKACVIMYALLQRSPMTATPVFSSMRTARK